MIALIEFTATNGSNFIDFKKIVRICLTMYRPKKSCHFCRVILVKVYAFELVLKKVYIASCVVIRSVSLLRPRPEQ
jgi:hypothetical protein